MPDQLHFSLVLLLSLFSCLLRLPHPSIRVCDKISFFSSQSRNWESQRWLSFWWTRASVGPCVLARWVIGVYHGRAIDYSTSIVYGPCCVHTYLFLHWWLSSTSNAVTSYWQYETVTARLFSWSAPANICSDLTNVTYFKIRHLFFHWNWNRLPRSVGRHSLRRCWEVERQRSGRLVTS